MALELDYLTLSRMAVAESATTPVPADGVGSLIWSTTVGDILRWDGAKWSLGITPSLYTQNLLDFSFISSSGLVYNYRSGALRVGSTTYIVPNGNITLTASADNYVEVSNSAVVSKNTIGFTSGSYPLEIVTTNASGVIGRVNKRGIAYINPPAAATVDPVKKIFFFSNT